MDNYSELFKKLSNYECDNQMTLEDFGINMSENNVLESSNSG